MMQRILFMIITTVFLGGRFAPAQSPFPALTDAEQRQLDSLLAKWQEQSQKIKTMECRFQKWRYDVSRAPRDTHCAWSQGVIKYMAPDRGLFKEESIQFYTKDASGKPSYQPDSKQLGDWWVCTGTELVFMNRSDKVCTIEELPPQMQGQQLFESPLPFVFNLDAERMKQRFWIRNVAMPPGNDGSYMLEVYPKQQKDAQLYKLVQVVISSSNFMPKFLLIYPPNYDAATAPNKEIYEFSEVKANQGFLERAAEMLFRSEFINPQPPSNDWKIIRNPPPQAAVPLKTAEQPPAAQPGPARPAVR